MLCKQVEQLPAAAGNALPGFTTEDRAPSALKMPPFTSIHFLPSCSHSRPFAASQPLYSASGVARC